MTFTIAHLSDPHVPSRLRVVHGGLAGKRLGGYLNWALKRRHVHRTHVLTALAADLTDTRPDHVVVTGDLVNIGLASEYAHAAEWLKTLGTPDHVTIVPGNHDAYVARMETALWHAWAPYLAADHEAEGAPLAHTWVSGYPRVRRRGTVAFVCLSTALPTGFGRSWGWLGATQLDATAQILRELGEDGLCRIVLLHHPIAPLPRDKSLRDADALRAILADVGAELVLHGHEHRAWLDYIPGRAQHIPVLSVSSASADPRQSRHGAQYHLLTVETEGGTPHISLRTRVYHAGRDCFEAVRAEATTLLDGTDAGARADLRHALEVSARVTR